jgi:hypothetical protein
MHFRERQLFEYHRTQENCLFFKKRKKKEMLAIQAYCGDSKLESDRWQ